MPSLSQPLDDKVAERLGLLDDDAGFSESVIKSQRMGKLFDDIEIENSKIDLKTRIKWMCKDIKDFLGKLKQGIQNRRKWRKAVTELRSWNGYSGLISVMQTHLRHYIEYEEKYGHSEESCRKRKIATAKETIELLERMTEPMDYSSKRLEDVTVKYPDYKSLITDYANGSRSSSGDFIPQGNGWAGTEAGEDPRKGYFEFVNGRLELATSPDQAETDRILAQIHEYYDEIHKANAQADTDSQEDFDRLAQLFKENFYTWWD